MREDSDAGLQGADSLHEEGGTDSGQTSQSFESGTKPEPRDAANAERAVDAAPGDAGTGPASDGGSVDAATDARAPDAETPTGPHCVLPPATPPHLETLVSPDGLPSSENGAFTDDGRLFVIGGSNLYEIVGGPSAFRAEVFAKGDACIFGGLTARGRRLYAACTSLWSLTGDLFVYEPTRAQSLVGRAHIESTSFTHFNGMAFGPDGALYLSDSLGTSDPSPSVVRLEILEEQPLRLVQTAFVAAISSDRPANTGGGDFPNGIRFAGDVMYLVRGADVVAVPVGLHDPKAELKVAYAADGSLRTIDDFDIGDGRMWLTEFESLRSIGLPGESLMVVTDLQGHVEFKIDLPFVGSSTIISASAPFGPSILLTSFFDGGLYRLTFD
jgi:hypothetical protein